MGKSHLIQQMIKFRADVFSVSYSRIIYACPDGSKRERAEYITSLIENCPNLEISEGFPTIEDYYADPNSHCLLIFDDFLEQIQDSRTFRRLMMKDSHHNRLSVIVTSQNAFYPGKFSVTILRNYR